MSGTTVIPLDSRIPSASGVGAVGSLYDQSGAHAVGIGGGEHALDSSGDDDGHVEFRELLRREGVGTGEAGDGPGGVDVRG